VLIWNSDENFGTNCDNLDMLIKEISETVEVGLDNVDAVGITEVLESHSQPEVLESHSQPMFNEEIYDLAQQLVEQQKKDEGDEDHRTKGAY
jgi:hypothetical protein